MAGLRGGLGAQGQVAPMRQPKRGGGGGGGNKQRNRNAGLGTGAGGGGGANAGQDLGLYGGEAGKAAANQDPAAFIRNVLTQSGVLRGTGTSYDTWADEQLQKNILDAYNAAGGLSQGLDIQDFIRNTYGAGYGGKKGTEFTAGNFGGAQGTAADWDKYQSNAETDTWLNNKLAQGGGFIGGGGGNQDFQAWFGQQFAPNITQQWEAAKAAQMQAGPATQGAAGGAGNAQTTLPIGSSGDFGGDPMQRRAWMRDQGINGRLNRMNQNRRADIKSQYADYQAGFDPQQTAPGGSTAGSATGANAPMSMSEYLNGRDITAEARAAYLLRPNTMRTPSSTGLGGRYSWWE